MGHLDYSGVTVHALYCYFVILESFLCYFYDHIFLRLPSFEILPCTVILLFYIDNSILQCIYTVTFFNLDQFYIQRSEPGSLALGVL